MNRTTSQCRSVSSGIPLSRAIAAAIDSFHWSGSVMKPSASTSTGASAIRVMVISSSSHVAGTSFLPRVGMVGPMPGMSRPGSRTCQ